TPPVPAPPVNVAPPRVVEPPPRVVEPPPRFERPQAAPVRETPAEAAPVRRERPAALESVPVSPPRGPEPQAMEPESVNFGEAQS
ncbi:MAG TPA: energy transducer TonB, partial [Thermoleptolyngbya sp. M55_K2018_002]|nr:energy transducer TonB [Thermoleptolyngbya sp. M55_K2018_002]